MRGEFDAGVIFFETINEAYGIKNGCLVAQAVVRAMTNTGAVRRDGIITRRSAAGKYSIGDPDNK